MIYMTDVSLQANKPVLGAVTYLSPVMETREAYNLHDQHH